MVATRRGGRVSSPTTNVEEKQSVVQATPSTARRTRRAQQDECNAQQTLGETCKTGPLETPATSKKRCTRSSRLHSPEEPSTPVSSVHEGEMSDVESLCSAVSDAEPPLTRARGRMRPLSGKDQEHETSEVESCSSAVSPAKPKISSSRSTRRKPAQTSSQSEVDSGKVGTVPEAEPSSSAVSESQRVTRSQRKAAPARASVRRHAEDSELSEAESCTSSISGRRSRRLIRPIPIHLDELPESSQCPTRTTRQTKASRRTAVSTEEDEKEQCCDSEGFESGPIYSLSTCRRGRSQSAVSKTALDSESEDVNSSGGSRGTPCSSRAGSGSSSRRAPTSRRSTRSSNVLETTQEPCEEESSFNDSKSESTVFGEDMDSTLVEEQQVQTSGEQQSLVNAEITSSGADDEKVEKEKVDESEDMELPGSACAEDVSEPAVITKDLKEELSSESKAGEASEMDMEEVIPPSQPVQTLQSVPETAGGTDSEMTELIEEKQKAADEPLEDEDEADVEILPSVEETLEAQVKASQQGKVSIESESEQQPKAAVVQKTKNISLLHSSDDEDSFSEEEEDRMSDDEDDPGNREERAGSSSVSKVASASAVEGLFMIDTRPGQDADQQYYREEEEEEEAHGKAQQEDEEEFIDEEGDEEDDEDSKVLFFSRNPQLKDLSSRIDPGLRVKELGGLYISFDGSKSKPVSSSLQKLKEKKSHDEIMKKSVIGPDFEKKDAVPPYSESKQALKLKRRAEREKSTGDGWFNMKAPEISQELKGDLKLLKMRGSLDPKRFYKKNDRDGFPKYFQMGTVVDSPADFYHSRIPKKERKRTMVEELLNDAEFRLKNKKKYQQIIAEKAALTAGKRNKKKKFHKK